MPEDGLTGNRAFDAVIRGFDRLTALMSTLGTIGILFLMGLITADVIGRFVFARPIAGVPEIVAMTILSIVFLQLANTLMRGKLTRADGLLNMLTSRSPALGLCLDGLTHLAGAGMLAVLVSAFYPLFMRAFGRGETVGTVGHFIAPIWPSYLIVLVGASALCIGFLIRAAALFYRAAGAAGEPQ